MNWLLRLGESLRRTKAIEKPDEPPPVKAEWATVIFERVANPVGVRYGVLLTCSLCRKSQPAYSSNGEVPYEPYSPISYGHFIAWEMPPGWVRVTVDGVPSLVCPDHDCLAPRTTKGK